MAVMTRETGKKLIEITVVLLVLSLSGCGKKLEVREWRYQDGRLKARGTVYQDQGGSYVKNGLWREWYPNGQMSLQRSYYYNRLDGTVIGWHENGRKELEGKFKSGMPDGKWTWWYDNENRLMEGNWRTGLKHGLWTWWYDNGRKEMEGKYKRGEADGEWNYWDRSGEWLKKEVYRDGRLVKKDTP